VHAVKGKREEYGELKSALSLSSQPTNVAFTFKSLGFSELYIADLDAIMGKGENLAVVKEIAEETGLHVIVDAGVSSFRQISRLFQLNASKVIIGTETLFNLDFIKGAITRFKSERIVVSLDLKLGQIISKSDSVCLMSPIELGRELEKIGVSELILLDLAKVGSGEGVDFDLIRELLHGVTVKILVGGGVRNATDLLALKNLGVDGVLLATSLHSGSISTDELKQLKLL